LTVQAKQGEFITMLYPGRLPAVRAVAGGVRVGDDEILFAGSDAGTSDSVIDDAATYVTVSRANRTVASLSGKDIDLNRSQGEIGLFVPDAGYPFGEIADRLIRQRRAGSSSFVSMNGDNGPRISARPNGIRLGRAARCEYDNDRLLVHHDSGRFKCLPTSNNA
jgi:hypothetical protein